MSYWDGIKVYAKLEAHRKKVERSKRIIENFLELTDGNAMVSWSGGKDSTALAHLVASIKPDIAIISEKDDLDFPGEKEYVKSVAEKFGWNLTIIEPEESLWEFVKKEVNVTEDIHSRAALLSKRFFYPLMEKMNRSFKGVFLGLRAEESKHREKNFQTRGFIYQKKDRSWICIPIAHWTADDVFAYLIAHDIPILDIYKKFEPFFDSPKHIRKAWWIPGGNARHGYVSWLRYHYPDLYARLIEIFPEVKSYG